MYKIKIEKYISTKANRKKADDTWYYKFQKPGFNKNGGRLYAYKAGFSTKAEAEEAAEKEYMSYYGPTAKTDSRITDMVFSSYVENHWWKVSVTMWKQGTIRNYRKYLNNYLLPRFGNIPLCDISQEILQKYFNDLYLSSSASVNTINNLRTLMSQILKFACNNRHILYNPMASVQKPNLRISTSVQKNKQVRGLIDDETIEKILKRFPEESASFLPFIICLEAGLRIGEAFGLSWDDISFENHCIFVVRQLQRRERKVKCSAYEIELLKQYPQLENEMWCTCNPKYESRRAIPMSEKLEAALYRAKERQNLCRRMLGNKYIKYYYTREKEPPSYSDFSSFLVETDKNPFESGIVNNCGIGYEIDFVNRYDDGTIVTENTMKHLSRIVQGKEKEEAIFEHYNTHSLRHTFASKLRASGVDEHIVQALLGHKSTKETKTYLHITEKEYISVSVNMNNNLSKVDAIIDMIKTHGLSAQQIRALIGHLEAEVA